MVHKFNIEAIIDSIWEETLWSRQTQVDSSEEIKYYIPFEFKEPDNPTTTEMEIGFAPLDLSSFPGYFKRVTIGILACLQGWPW